MSKVMRCNGQYVANDPCYPVCSLPDGSGCDYSGVFGGGSIGGPTEQYSITTGNAVTGNTSTRSVVPMIDPYQSILPSQLSFDGSNRMGMDNDGGPSDLWFNANSFSLPRPTIPEPEISTRSAAFADGDVDPVDFRTDRIAPSSGGYMRPIVYENQRGASAAVSGWTDTTFKNLTGTDWQEDGYSGTEWQDANLNASGEMEPGDMVQRGSSAMTRTGCTPMDRAPGCSRRAKAGQIYRNAVGSRAFADSTDMVEGYSPRSSRAAVTPWPPERGITSPLNIDYGGEGVMRNAVGSRAFNDELLPPLEYGRGSTRMIDSEEDIINFRTTDTDPTDDVGHYRASGCGEGFCGPGGPGRPRPYPKPGRARLSNPDDWDEPHMMTGRAGRPASASYRGTDFDTGFIFGV